MLQHALINRLERPKGEGFLERKKERKKEKKVAGAVTHASLEHVREVASSRSVVELGLSQDIMVDYLRYVHAMWLA